MVQAPCTHLSFQHCLIHLKGMKEYLITRKCQTKYIWYLIKVLIQMFKKGLEKIMSVIRIQGNLYLNPIVIIDLIIIFMDFKIMTSVKMMVH